MVTEKKNEYLFDGDGRPVQEEQGMRNYHISEPPTGELETTPFGYQVWSTVLGQSLTMLNADGTKQTTKVFAGGAVIARQGSGGASWTTADPVSGTVANLWATGSNTEQTEPIGQTLHIIDPEDPPQPIPPDTMIQNADYPQWRCEERNASQLYGGFHEWPEECRKRYMQDMDVNVYEFSKNDAEQNPANLNKLINNLKHTLPSSDAGLVFATRSMMSRALTSSTRDDDEGDGCDWDKDGKPDCAVSVTYAYQPIDMSDTGGPDASVAQNSLLGDPCDISDLRIPSDVNIASNVRTASSRYTKTKLTVGSNGVLALSTAPIPGIGLAGLAVSAGGTVVAATNHARWFYNMVNDGGDWDYKTGSTELIPGTGKSIYEPFGNFHYGVVGAAAGFDRGNTLQRMAGYVQERNSQKSDGGEHGGLTSIIADFVANKTGGEYPYKDEKADQSLIERGRAYYYAGCYNR